MRGLKGPFPTICGVVLVFRGGHVEEPPRRRIAREVLAGIFAPLHVRVPVAFGEVIACHSDGWEGAGDLAVAVVDAVHKGGRVAGWQGGRFLSGNVDFSAFNGEVSGAAVAEADSVQPVQLTFIRDFKGACELATVPGCGLQQAAFLPV